VWVWSCRRCSEAERGEGRYPGVAPVPGEIFAESGSELGCGGYAGILTESGLVVGLGHVSEAVAGAVRVCPMGLVMVEVD
jgi:hypothetical protein